MVPVPASSSADPLSVVPLCPAPDTARDLADADLRVGGTYAATLFHDLLNPDVGHPHVNKSGIAGHKRLRMDGLPIFEINEEGFYVPSIKTREVDEGDIPAPRSPPRTASGGEEKRSLPAGEGGRVGARSLQPSISGVVSVPINYFSSGRRHARLTLATIRVDAMRAVHIELLSQVSHLLGGLHRELSGHLRPGRLPSCLRAVAASVDAAHISRLGPVSLGAPTSVLAAEAHRRLTLYTDLFDRIDRTPGAMDYMARVLPRYLHQTVAEPETVETLDYYGGSKTLRHFTALVLRQDQKARGAAESYLAACDALASLVMDDASIGGTWLGPVEPGERAPQVRPLGRQQRKDYLDELKMSLGGRRPSADLDRKVADFTFSAYVMDAHPAAVALGSFFPVLSLQRHEPRVEEPHARNNMLVNPKFFALPQDVADRARHTLTLIESHSRLNPLGKKLRRLAREADQFARETFCDGHLALQTASLLQRPATQRRLALSLEDMEAEARRGIASMLEEDPPAAAKVPRARPPAAVRASPPKRRPRWWTDEDASGDPHTPALDLPGAMPEGAPAGPPVAVRVGGSPTSSAPTAPSSPQRAPTPLPLSGRAAGSGVGSSGATGHRSAHAAGRRPPPPTVALGAGLKLPSRLSKEALGELLVSTFDPGTFAATYVEPVQASAASASYHLGKHGAPGAAVEEYIFEARQAFLRHFVGEVSARAGSFGDRIKMLHTEDHYGCFAWDERILTFCNRRRCGSAHFPGKNAP